MNNQIIPGRKDHPLRYISEALRQIEKVLRDFGLNDAAQLLEKALADIEAALPKQQDDGEPQV